MIKRAVPLALALLSVSNPKLNIIDTLSKFSHDADHEVSYNSIFAMGIVGAGELIRERKRIDYPTVDSSRDQQCAFGRYAPTIGRVSRKGYEQSVHGSPGTGSYALGQRHDDIESVSQRSYVTVSCGIGWFAHGSRLSLRCEAE